LLGDAPAGDSPVVAPIGGETTFDPIAGWSVLLSVHWVHNKQPIQESPATWNAIKQIRVSYEQPDYPWWYPILGIPLPPPVEVGAHTPERDILWGDGPGYHFGESVTWCDMKHISESGTQVERSEERRVGKEGGGGWGSGYESEKEPERWGRGDGKAQGRGGGSWHGTT